MSEILIRNAKILTMAGGHDGQAFDGDILIEGQVIKAIGTGLVAAPDAEILDGRDRLVMPGLINAHTHSSEMFYRGRYQKMPLETWLLYSYPFFGNPPLSLRMLYLRSMLVAAESLKSGVTMISDDFFDPPAHDLDRLSTVFSAYDDIGIRANVSSGLMNLPYLDTLAFAREIFPAEIQKTLDFPLVSTEHYMDYCAEVFRTLHGTGGGRLRFMLAPSGPQRCSTDLMLACRDLAIEKAVPFHTHVLETKTQSVTGRKLFGGSLVRYMHDLGLLHRGVLMAHSVWIGDDDIALMGAAGVSVSYNALANLKLGSGVCPVRRLLDAGVNIGLGTDGASSNDTVRLFDVMRTAALVQSATGPDHDSWLGAEDVLHAATRGGARAAMLENAVGSLEIGKQADLVVLDLTRTTAFTPLSDVVRQLVFCENGQSVESVMVAGKFAVRDGRLTMIDEAALMQELRELLPAYIQEHGRVEAANRHLEPYFEAVIKRCSAEDVGMSRFVSG